jgi:hypothetical protein
MLLEPHIISIKYFHNMFRHWTPDQLTPRANEKNPFNDVPTTPTAVHPLLSSGLSVTSDLTPAQPTTHLSIHAPIFIMQQPPPAKNLIIKQPPSSSTPPSSKGQIHVKLIQARALNVRSLNARPYVVVQFEQNEFVSRDPTLESDKEVKGAAISLSRSISSAKILRHPQPHPQNYLHNFYYQLHHLSLSSVACQPIIQSGNTRFLCTSSTLSLIVHPIFIPLSDVTSEASVITFNVYDRAVLDQGFLGTAQIKPVLIHDHTVDQWYKYVLIIIVVIQIPSNIPQTQAF